MKVTEVWNSCARTLKASSGDYQFIRGEFGLTAEPEKDETFDDVAVQVEKLTLQECDKTCEKLLE